MAACPSRMAMSDAEPLPGGVKVMLGPVGNSPGPDLIVSVTATLLLIGLSLASTTVTKSQVPENVHEHLGGSGATTTFGQDWALDDLWGTETKMVSAMASAMVRART